MSVFDDLLEDTQPGYVPQMQQVLSRMIALFGDHAFDDVDKAAFVSRALKLAQNALSDPQARVQMVADLATMSWWCGLEIRDDDYAVMGELARRVYFDQIRAGVSYRQDHADPKAKRAHAVLAGAFVDNPFHSPTRGAFDYARALAADPENRLIEVLHGGALTSGLMAYARHSLGPLFDRVRFTSTDGEPEFLGRIIGEGPRTYHIWCEPPLNINISLVALFGPTLMFTCGDSAPVQFADLYWYAHDSAYLGDLWRRRGVPESFIANYRRLDSSPFPQAGSERVRTRAEHGFGVEETIIVTVGNRLGVDMDQPFVDGMAAVVLANPACRWVIVGALQDFWIGAFEQVLGEQFTHIPFDGDLAGLLGVTDIFANPFRAGGGNTVITAVDSGAVVLTRNFGDAAAWVPDAHQASDAETYFAELRALVEDPVLRAARLAEQQALMARRLDQAAFAQQLKAAVDLAFERFKARTPGRLEAIFGLAERKLGSLTSGSGRLGRSKPPRRAPRR